MKVRTLIAVLLLIFGGYIGYGKWIESRMLHYSCGDLDFKLGSVNYDAIINGEHLKSKDWRLLPDPAGEVEPLLRHKWLGSTHHYEVNGMSMRTTLDGRECVLIPR